MPSGSIPAEARLRAAADLFAAGLQLMRENIRRRSPDASEDEIEEQLLIWMHDRPGAEAGDAVGRPVRLPRAPR